MPLDPEVKRNLDMRLALGKVSQAEYQELLSDLECLAAEIGAPVDREMPTGMHGQRPVFAPREWKAGDVLATGCYRLIDPIGRGAMGQVWRAVELSSESFVALKRLPIEVSGTPFELERVRDNFKLVRGLIHEHIAAAHGLAIDPPETILVMEYVEGRDLRPYREAMIAARGTFPLEEALRLAAQIARALDFAHARGVIHRDIKPGNIRVTPQGSVKLLDFGIAAEIHSSFARVVHSDAITGTRRYMPPEQWRGQPQHGAADQYALAVLLYEMIAGNTPFSNPDTEVLMQFVLSEPPPPIASLTPAQNTALQRALSKDPTARFASCGEFVAAMQSAGTPNLAPVPPPPIPGHIPPPPIPAAALNGTAAKSVSGLDEFAKRLDKLYVQPPASRVFSDENFQRLKSLVRGVPEKSFESEILFLGGPRTGKTVLLACLARHFQAPSPDGVKIGCGSQRAMEFRDKVCNSLLAQRWPAPTMGGIAQLTMQLETPFFNSPLHLYDFPGEVYIHAFASFLASDQAAAALRESVARASVALLLVSAYDVFEGDIRTSSAWAACEYARYLHSLPHAPRLCVVVTGAASYRDEINAAGGPIGVVRARLPDLFNLYPKEEFHALAVSAVAETVNVDGHELPAPRFRSRGLEELMEWVSMHHVLGCARRHKKLPFWKR